MGPARQDTARGRDQKPTMMAPVSGVDKHRVHVANELRALSLGKRENHERGEDALFFACRGDVPPRVVVAVDVGAGEFGRRVFVSDGVRRRVLPWCGGTRRCPRAHREPAAVLPLGGRI